MMSENPSCVDQEQNSFSTAENAKLSRFLLLGAVGLITCLAFEALATTNAMPLVVKDLGGDAWYSLAVGITLTGQIISTVLAGWITDRSGVRLPLLGGVLLFMFGAFITAIAPVLTVFTLGRLAQGLGSGLAYVPIYVLVGQLVAPQRRPRFFAAFTYAWMLPGIVGPALSGIIIQHWHWRPVFWLIIPFSLIALVPLIPILRYCQSPSTKPVDTSESDKPDKPPLLAIFLTGIAILLWQVAGGFNDLWPKSFTIFIGLIILCFSLPRLLPSGTLRAKPGLPAFVAMRTLAMGAVIGGEFFIPLLLNRLHHWPASHTGWALTIGAIGWAAGSWFQSKITNPQTRTRLPWLGSILVFIGLLIASALQISSIPVPVALGGWSTVVFGLGMAVSTTSDISLAIIPPSQHGQASAALQLADSLGPALMLGFTSVALSTWQSYIDQTAPFLPAWTIAVLFAGLALVAITRNRNLSLPT